MGPTGSMFGRSWRTSWRARSRLIACCLLGGLAMLLAVRADAGWRTSVSMPGRPNEALEVWAPGSFSVGYEPGVGNEHGSILFRDGGLYRRMMGGTNNDGASAGNYYLVAEDCFISIKKDVEGTRFSSGGDGGPCANPSGITFPGNPMLRVRHVPGGGAVALAGESSRSDVFFSDTGIYDPGPFGIQVAPDTSLNGTLGVVRVGDTLHALAGTGQPNARVVWIDSKERMVSQSQSDPSVGGVQAVELFAAGSPPLPHAVVGTSRGFLQGSLRGFSSELRPVQMLDTGMGVTSLSMNVEAGSPNGYGFGMAVVSLPDGGHGVASPVPMKDATQAGTRWVLRNLPASISEAPLRQVACTGASYCVLTAHRADVDNLFVYTNDAGPRISADASVVLDEKQVLALTIGASDPDGDPVLVTASPSRVTTAKWSLEQADAGVDGGWLPGDPLVMKLTGGAVCENQLVGSFKIHASDGLSAHDAERDIQVYVNHTRIPEVPPVLMPDGGMSAGGEPITLKVAGDTTAAGCKLTHFEWTRRFTGPGPSLEQDGGTAVLTPPDILCEAEGKDFPFQLLVRDEAGLSNTADISVHVAPWGRPNAAFAADAGTVRMGAGDALVFSPTESLHACVGAPLFPGVETTWTVTADRDLPAGDITFLDADSKRPVAGFPIQAKGLVVETRACIEKTHLVLSAENRLRTPGGRAGPRSERHVEIQSYREPFSSGELLLDVDRAAPASGELRVGVDSTLDCPERRGLRADLRLERAGGETRAATVGIPGVWNIPLEAGCAGGRFQLRGTMVDDEGNASAERTVEVVVPRVEAGLEALAEEELPLVARCGEGARATLTQRFPQGTCQTPAVTWKQVAGPPLEQGALSGGTVSLATRDTGLDSLVGQSVVLEVTAEASPGNQASRQHVLPITVDPFVRVRRRAEVPAASDTGLVGVSVELTNTTACGVTDVSFAEHLEGLTYVEGSARFDGQPVEARWEDGALRVKGLALAGQGTGRLTYVARPHLVGERRMLGEARLREVPISLGDAPGPRVPVSGCGCSGSGPGPVLLALGALGVALRRRRR